MGQEQEQGCSWGWGGPRGAAGLASAGRSRAHAVGNGGGWAAQAQHQARPPSTKGPPTCPDPARCGWDAPAASGTPARGLHKAEPPHLPPPPCVPQGGAGQGQGHPSSASPRRLQGARVTLRLRTHPGHLLGLVLAGWLSQSGTGRAGLGWLQFIPWQEPRLQTPATRGPQPQLPSCQGLPLPRVTPGGVKAAAAAPRGRERAGRGCCRGLQAAPSSLPSVH